ncbi:hypothetical protein E4U50_001239 [Claviceps purpurea]|nr:hypothetical protein E4U36_004155 [Claviceps purpurea]KAG6213463.1 hypothetical protein E4U50_001239 [Claviceps purpurea]
MSMFLPRPPLTPSALTISASLTVSTSQRAFHSISHRNSSNGTGSGGKPIENPVAEHENASKPASVVETTAGPTRDLSAGTMRSYQSRRWTAPDLPPVKLPPSFICENVSIYDAHQRPRLPDALAEDMMHAKTSRLLMDQALRSYFDACLALLLERSSELTSQLLGSSNNEEKNIQLSRIDQIERICRLGDMIIDSARHLVDSMKADRIAEYSYKIRPFWWWDVYKHLSYENPDSKDLLAAVTSTLKEQLHHAESLDYPLAQSVPDFPIDALIGIKKTLARQLEVRPPSTSISKVLKRPITILSMSGYGGKAIAESLGRHLAYWNQADLIRLDAQDLSTLISEHLGLNWACARGAISNMGFRVAELNGNVDRESNISERVTEEDENGGVLSISLSSSPWQNVMRKFEKSSKRDSAERRERIKVDNVLQHILRAPELKQSCGPRKNPIILHLHDIVELNMTVEGSLLLGRLRTMVDSAWKEGIQIAILGTSSSKDTSRKYNKAVEELAISNWVVTEYIEPDDVDQRAVARKLQSTENAVSFQSADHFAENIRNINRMARALSPEDKPPVLNASSEGVKACLRSTDPRFSILRDSILSFPEVYNMACTLTASGNRPGGEERGETDANILSECCSMGSLVQKRARRTVDEELDDSLDEDEEQYYSHGSGPGLDKKLNEYEKRIAACQIHRENLRTTFADVHAPLETISALKLLTSLALTRPDAFTYGVLSQDRIPGCLLYGPPGTGKTMLAKAVAKESGANMLEVSGATLNDKYVGESEKLIRAIFTLAKRLEPCVVFIDEADSLLANRGMYSNRNSHREHINQFLKEWDGLEETNAFIMVATNRPFDLDDAVLRRLPRKILVDLPLANDRTAILRLLLRDETLDPAVDIEKLAHRTPYYSGSDLKNLCVAAAMAAVEEENNIAAQHKGPDAYQYPARRTLRNDHFEVALKQIPASISQDMTSLKQIRKFDQEFGNARTGGAKRKPGMGFGSGGDKDMLDGNEARIRT